MLAAAAAAISRSNSATSDLWHAVRSPSISRSTGWAKMAHASRRRSDTRAANVTMPAASADNGPGAAAAAMSDRGSFLCGDTLDQGRNEVVLRRKIAIDRAGGDAGACRNRDDLHRIEPVLACDLARGYDDGIAARVQPLDDTFGAAIGHEESGPRINRLDCRQEMNHDSGEGKCAETNGSASTPVIPGRCEAASPKSRGNETSSGCTIPGPPFGRPGMTPISSPSPARATSRASSSA